MPFLTPTFLAPSRPESILTSRARTRDNGDWAHGQCDRAIDILDLALDVSCANDGLFNTGQLAIYEPLLNCYTTLDRPDEFKRAQHYVLLIHETSVGQNDPRLLPALDQAARGGPILL